jgi:hypothetical protein
MQQIDSHIERNEVAALSARDHSRRNTFSARKLASPSRSRFIAAK